MAYRLEQTQNGKADIVIDGWDQGIADSAYKGLSDMRNVNIISVPGEASVNFNSTAMTKPPAVTSLTFTVETTDIFTVASTSGWYNGMALTLNTLVDGTGLATGRVYWVGDLSGNTFKLYKGTDYTGTPVNVTLAGSGTLSTYTLGKIIDKAIDYTGGNSSSGYKFQFFLDDNGLVWWINNRLGSVTNNLTYLGNDTTTSSGGNRGLNIWNRYIFVFRATKIDYLPLVRVEADVDLDGASGWVYDWQTVSDAFIAARPTFVGQDNILYYSNGMNRIGSIIENSGKTFDPTDGTTYTKNIAALNLINGDTCTSLGELGLNLYIGTKRNVIYPWDRVSTNPGFLMFFSENYISRIVNANTSAYIFAGNRGRIFVTNGANIALFKKFPDSLTGLVEPYYIWKDAVFWKNQLYFSFDLYSNAGVLQTTCGGVWALDLDTGAIRQTNKLSYDTYGGTANIIVANVLTNTPGGAGIYVGWDNSSTYGVDITTANPYSGGQSTVESDIIPVGQFLQKRTFECVEFKLSAPLVANESVALYYKPNLTGSYINIPITQGGGVGDISGVGYINFENVQWVVIKAVLTSTSTTPSFVRLREIRLR